MQKLKTAREVAGKILNSYPDYAKATPSFTGAVIEAIAQYPAYVQHALAHPTRGVQGKSTFLPTVADIVKLADELTAKAAGEAAFNAKFSNPFVVAERQTKVFRPFPRLWEALGEGFMDDFIQRWSVSFDLLDEAARRLPYYGKAESLKHLEQGKRPHKSF